MNSMKKQEMLKLVRVKYISLTNLSSENEDIQLCILRFRTYLTKCFNFIEKKKGEYVNCPCCRGKNKGYLYFDEDFSLNCSKPCKNGRNII